MKYLGHNNFKYYHSDGKWIYMDCNISTVTMSYNAINGVYPLDRICVGELEIFVIKNYIRFMYKICACA